MEGVSHEAASLAGHLGLAKLIVLFDDNAISIDGPTALSVADDVPARFASLWLAHLGAVDGHDPDAVAAAIEAAQADGRPSLIACRTVIGFGAPNKAGTAGSHGAPLGEDEIAGARQGPRLGPAGLRAAGRRRSPRGGPPARRSKAGAREAWRARRDRRIARGTQGRVRARGLRANCRKVGKRRSIPTSTGWSGGRAEVRHPPILRRDVERASRRWSRS